MPAMDTTVKHFNNFMTNSGNFLADLNNAAGRLITVLDACLVNGFGDVAPSSITVSSGVATATFGVAHPFLADTVALITGATPSGLNGEHKVISTTTTTVTFDAFGIEDGAASGSITMKLAPLGWSKVYSGTNKAVYRSADITGTRRYLRVDDTIGGYAKIRGYETMSSVDVGEFPFPRFEQFSDASYNWFKSSNSTGKYWWIMGNSKIFYFGLRGHADTLFIRGANFVQAFGDIQSTRPTDNYKCIISAFTGTTNQSSRIFNIFYFAYDGSNPKVFPRSITQYGLPVGFDQSSTAVPKGTGHVPGYTPGFGFPNSADNGISLSEQAIFEGWYLRGWMPGTLCPLQGINYTDFYNDDYINNYMSHPKKLIFKSFDHDSYPGGAFFDLTGPWNN